MSASEHAPLIIQFQNGVFVLKVSLVLEELCKSINPFFPNAPDSTLFFWWFQGVESRWIGNEWVNTSV